MSGKGKHGPRKSGKGSVKDTPPVARVKTEPDDLLESANPFLIRNAENNRYVVRYSQVLTRGKEGSVGMEELDALQLELEVLLSCAAMRHRAILEEISQMEALDERNKKIKQTPKPIQPVNAGKRSSVRPETSRPPKKFKSDWKPEVSKPETPSGGKLNRLRGLPSDGDVRSPKPDVPEVPKYELPDKFWASVDAYCRQITQEDVTYLQDLIKAREEEAKSELFIIPPLGKHYTLKWAEEDAGDVKQKPAVLGGTSGPMTQRLVSALVEERNSPLPLDDDRSRDLSAQRAAALAHVKSAAFENRVREELREQGILDGDEAPTVQADDELLLELRRCQSELTSISTHNLLRLKHLLTLAEAQMQRQELKRKLQVINTELLKVHASKLEKKYLSKKEKEAAWRYIKEMKAILKELYPTVPVKQQQQEQEQQQ